MSGKPSYISLLLSHLEKEAFKIEANINSVVSPTSIKEER